MSAPLPSIQRASPLRVCYFGTYRAEYSRNQIMVHGLRSAGVDVVECHVRLWRDIEDRVAVTRGGWRSLGFVLRVLRAYAALLRAHAGVGGYDVLVLGYPGYFDVFLARLLSWWRRRPLVLDCFMSLYLIATERGLQAASPLTVQGLRWVEAAALRLPNRLISDTAAYRDWFTRTYQLAPERFRLVPTGADDTVFQPVTGAQTVGQRVFKAAYYGTFIPNHGLPYILEAARLLNDQPDIQFELIGNGPDRPAAEALAQRYQLRNVAFRGWMEPAALREHAGRADVLLGAFGQTPQSLMTVQNKIYEGLALARPVISGDAPAVRAHLRAGEHLCLVDRERPEALAQALLDLRQDPALRARLAEAGHRFFLEHYSIAAIGKRLAAHLGELVPERAGAR